MVKDFYSLFNQKNIKRLLGFIKYNIIQYLVKMNEWIKFGYAYQSKTSSFHPININYDGQ